MKIKTNCLSAIVVTYNPEPESLLKLLRVISPQVKSIFVIDNGSMEITDLSDIEKVNLITLNSNVGIAAAQNIGIRRAIQDGSEDIILFDQDSLPSKTMIEELYKAKKLASEAGCLVAAVGPVHIDQDTAASSTFIIANSRVKKLQSNYYTSSYNRFSECSFLIASGCLISKDALDDIGLMEEALFIDCVDIEWGFRAVSKGWSCVAAFDANMFHKIGDAPLSIFGRNLTTHSPLRHYYFYRNFYNLLKRKYIPTSWKMHTIIKSSAQAFVFCAFLHPRLKHFKFILKGIWHGVHSRGGKYEY